MRKRIIPAIVMIGVAGLLAGCDLIGGKPASPADGRDCFPAAARPFLAKAGGAAPAMSDTGGPLVLFVDGSASMAGYVRAGQGNERLLPDLVAMLPTMPGLKATPVERVVFNRGIKSIDAQTWASYTTAEAYLCPAANPNCDAQESHLRDALQRIADRKGPEKHPDAALSVVISDLWMDDKSLNTSGSVALAEQFNRIFAKGHSIAVYGFEVPYNGRVADLPSQRRDVTAQARHLFMLVVGPLPRLRAFHTLVMGNAGQRAASPAIAAAVAGKRSQHALFTLDPAIQLGTGSNRFIVPTAGALRSHVFLPAVRGVNLPQWEVVAAQARRESTKARSDGKAAPAATWTGFNGKDIIPETVWQGDVAGRVDVWRLRGSAPACRAGGADWLSQQPLEASWSTSSEKAAATLPATKLAGLGNGTFLLVGTATRTSLTQPNPQTVWLRTWSFDSETEAAAIAKPVMPTLNLAEIARLLESALVLGAEQHPATLGGFAVAVQVK